MTCHLTESGEGTGRRFQQQKQQGMHDSVGSRLPLQDCPIQSARIGWTLTENDIPQRYKEQHDCFLVHMPTKKERCVSRKNHASDKDWVGRFAPKFRQEDLYKLR